MDILHSEEEVKVLGGDDWTEGNSVSISPDRKCVVYAKITDQAGNAAYLSSDGLVFDKTAPEISGIMDGAIYRRPQTVTVTDANLESVKVNGTEVSLNNDTFTLGAASGEQTVVAMDKAGNTAAATVTVKTDAENVEDAKAVVEDALEKIPATNDTAKEDILSLIEDALRGEGITDVTVTIGDLTKVKATEEEKGSIDGEITIRSGDISGSVSVHKTIAKLTHTHNYGTDWESDEAEHWHVCACGEKSEIGSHNYGEWTVTKPANEQEDGLKERSCSICGYKESESIPKTGGISTGKVDTDVQKDDKAPTMRISTSAEELKDILLTEEEKQQVADGINVAIVLDVKDASERISREDKIKVEDALNGYTVGQYLDISLYKLIGESRTDITETAKKIAITITVPDSLKNPSGVKTRTFAVIRVHNGEAELLTDLDNDADTITIETDRFSSYTIVYEDTEKSADSGNTGNNGNNNANVVPNGNSTNSTQTKGNVPKTGDNMQLELYATLAMIAGSAYLLLYFLNRRRESR